MIEFNAYKKSINDIFTLIEKLSKQYKQFEPDLKNIENLNEQELFIIEGEKGYLTYTNLELDKLENFLKRLLTDEDFIKNYFYFVKPSQLHQLWNLLNVILNNANYVDISLSAVTDIKNSEKMSTEIFVKEIGNSKEYKELIKKNQLALIEAEKDINELLDNFRKDRSIIKTLFTDIILRRGTHHYTILKILKEAKNRSHLPYDIEDICSIEKKVKKGDSWVTDIIAIRNCIGHAKTKIDDDLNVHFWNDKEGYNFSRTYTFEEFLFFYQDFYRLLLIQKVSLTIVNLVQSLRNLLLSKK